MPLTTRLTATVVSSALLLFTLVACPGSDDGSASGTTCGDYLDVITAQLARCNTGSSGPSTHDRNRFLLLCTQALAAPGASNLGSQFQSCAQTLKTTCSLEGTTGCGTAVGTLANGTACGGSYQCQSGSCSIGEKATCGTCAARIAIGEACTLGAECVEGASCLFQSGQTGKCVPEKVAKAGESCASSDDATVTCGAGLTCSAAEPPTGSGPSTQTCAPLGAAGAACRDRYECEESLACTDGKCAPAVAAGGDCKLDECANGLGCDSSTKKCTALVRVAAGQECDLVHLCEQGNCSGMSFTTGALKPGKCVDPLPDGAACTSEDGSSQETTTTAYCDEYARCINGKCVFQNPADCK